jgi:hypothetical protein
MSHGATYNVGQMSHEASVHGANVSWGNTYTWGKCNRGAKVHGASLPMGQMWEGVGVGQLYNVGQMSVGANVDTPKTHILV